MLWLPARLMPILCLWSVPLSIGSYAVQALDGFRMGPAASSKRASALTLRWVGCLVPRTLLFCTLRAVCLVPCAVCRKPT